MWFDGVPAMERYHSLALSDILEMYRPELTTPKIDPTDTVITVDTQIT